MRKEWFLSLIFIVSLSCAKQPSSLNLVGTWVGEGPGEKIRFEFYPDGTCGFFFGKEDSESSQVTGDCKLDFSKRPIPLMIRNIPQLDHPVHTIVEFEGVDEIRIGEFAPAWRLRPLIFDPRLSLNLKRVKTNRRPTV